MELEKVRACWDLTVLYPTRYQARKHANARDVVVKVVGGYKIMTAFDYKLWRHQK